MKSTADWITDEVGEFRYVTESYLLDFKGRITLSLIATYLLQAASSHAAKLGFGYSDMTARNSTWVLSRLAIEVYHYPGADEQITLYTWIEETSSLFSHRSFELVDGNGEVFVHARSIWAAIDLETRRPVHLDTEEYWKHRTDRVCPIERPGKIPSVENDTLGEPYRVKYSDLDINTHLNSIKYIEHLLDLFDIELFKQKGISRFEIAYLLEGKYGMELMLHSKESAPGKYDMAICHEGKAICRASAKFGD
ncbi:acyl-ACP thioesterase [Bacteroidia bacterium]|nr:acyl-ACP thioesterase [Bacteroidia bacterium]GHU54382.1 acyl-ACP thioesterase [Bacteroidia bacterium]GHV03621.1 acyl-ACP thioesterase [Bacteroidia bacterium]